MALAETALQNKNLSLNERLARQSTTMFGIGITELLVMALIAIVAFGIPVAALVLLILIYRNTRK